MSKHVDSRNRLLCDRDMLLDVSVHLVLTDEVRNLIDSPCQRCCKEEKNEQIHEKMLRIALALNMHSTNAYVFIIINTLQRTLSHFWVSE